MAEIRKVTEDFAVAPQLGASDFREIAEAGYRHIINNRPDGEGAGQVSSAEAAAACEAAGLTYRHAPFQGPPTADAQSALQAQFSEAEGPVLAYCRTGTRSITAWAMVQARRGDMTPDDIVAAARQAGYDLEPMKDLLRSLSNK